MTTTNTISMEAITEALAATVAEEIEEEIEVTTCDNCGCIIEDGEEYTTHDGRIVCGECAQDMTACDYCGELVDYDDLVTIYDEYGDPYEYVCEDCAPERGNYCEECGRWVNRWAWNDSWEMCEDCARRFNFIREYHDGNPNGVRFHGSTDWSILRGYIGVELEISGGYDYDDRNAAAATMLEALGWSGCDPYDDAHAEWDCSVEGFEWIFQPRTLEDWNVNRPAFERFLEVARSVGYHSEEGNGLHVHISRTAFGHDAEQVAENVAKIERLFSGANYDLMRALAGRDEDGARRWAPRKSGGDHETRDDYKRSVMNRSRSRYEAVNVTNRDTIEFRLGASTVDPSRFYGWLECLAWVVRRAWTITPAEVESFDSWFYTAPESVLAFCEACGVPVYEPPQLDEARLLDIIDELVGAVRRVATATGAPAPERLDVLRNVGGITPAEARVLAPRF